MKDLTREHELKTIFLFSLPILVGNLFQQLYNLADTVIVGNFLGKECLAAVHFSDTLSADCPFYGHFNGGKHIGFTLFWQ